MRCYLVSIVCLLFLTLFAADPAPAGISVSYLGPLSGDPTGGVDPIGDFILGNVGNPMHLVTDPDFYAAYTRCSIVSPLLCGCDCELGYEVTRFNVIVAKVGDDPVDAYLTVALGNTYEITAFPPDAVCFTPPGGETRYQWPFYCDTEESFTVADEGYYRIEVTPVMNCDCIYKGYTQALHLPVWMGGGWGTDLFFVTDEDPDHCVDYYGDPNMGMIWYHELAAEGSLLIWADAVCCQNPVETDAKSWDGVKALYR